MKLFRNSLLVLLAAILLGFLLLCAVYCLPESLFQSELEESAQVFQWEGRYPAEPYSQKTLDSFTDALMLLEAGNGGGEAPVSAAIAASYTLLPGASPDETLVRLYLDGEAEAARPAPYGRYWHGYLLFLKPLLAFFSYAQIRSIGTTVQFALLLGVLLLMLKKRRECLLPFLLTVLLLAPTAIALSLQFSSCYLLMLLEALLLLWDPKKLLNRRTLPYFFLLAGILTSYLDLLTAPTLTLSVPLVLVLSAEKEKGSLRSALLLCLMWGFGYAGMWAGKWLLASVQPGFLAELLSSLSSRVSSSDEAGAQITRLAALRETAKELFSNRFLNRAAVLLAVFSAGGSLRRRELLRAAHLRYLLPAAVPVLWILLLANHSYVHSWFTYRTLAPAVFALLMALAPGKTPEQTAR